MGASLQATPSSLAIDDSELIPDILSELSTSSPGLFQHLTPLLWIVIVKAFFYSPF